MKIIFDMSSVMWTSLYAGKDAEAAIVDFNGKKVQVNSFMFGYENAVNLMKAALDEFSLNPVDAIMVFEGKDSKKRRSMVDPTYKAGESKCPELYIEFNKLKDFLKETFSSLGAISVSQSFVEGDDVIAYLVQNLEEDCIVVTNDNDLIVLNGTNEYNSTCRVRVNGELAKNKYGDFDFKLVTLYKALVGDSSDKIKGCPGFGSAAWFKLNCTYGDDGCFELMHLLQTGQKDECAKIADENNCRFLNTIVDNWAQVQVCLRLTHLHPEWVNTVKLPLEWSAGMTTNTCKDERLKKWTAQARLITAQNYTEAFKFLKEKLEETKEPSFDIETSTPEESDDWLAQQGKVKGVDVIGSFLVGFSITFGANNQYTYYVSVKHKDTPNITMAQAREMIELLFPKEIAIQNTNFELVVLYGDEAKDEDGTLWRDAWRKYGNFGMIPKVLDTKLEANYVDENLPSGLKQRSQMHLNYKQATYAETMTIDGVEHKMDEVPASHVFSYGADDTICTAALHNFYKLHMQLDHHYHIYKQVEIDAAYLHAKMMYDGIPVSMATLSKLAKDDGEVEKSSWEKLRAYLIAHGWEGTVPPVFSSELSCKDIKQAYAIVKGLDTETDDDGDEDEGDTEPKWAPKDEVMSSRVRTPAKLVELVNKVGEDYLARLIKLCLEGSPEELTKYVQSKFSGEPSFKMSNKQMCHLLYEVMGLPIRVRNKPTDAMKAKGLREGNPKGDDLAIQYAIDDAKSEEEIEVLNAIKLMQMVKVRKSLFYEPYPKFLHWKTGRVHGSHNQCATNTRRASASKPNFQQLSVKENIKGFAPKIRNAIVPHTKGAVVVSMDFSAQELRLIAEQSQDANMLACYVGDNKKDMHSLTGSAIARKSEKGRDWSYEAFVAAIDDDASEGHSSAKVFRGKGKNTNFAVSFGAMADKIALQLHITPEEAQTYIDAREATFPDEVKWKKRVIEESLSTGVARTLSGAVRHLASAINSPDRYTASKAERQSVNFRIQGSAAEQTKLAEGRFWRSGVFEKFDAQYYIPVHDETVMSVKLDQLEAFIKEAHPHMTAPYATMKVPVESSIGFGFNFGELVEIGTEPSEKAIKDGVTKLLGR